MSLRALVVDDTVLYRKIVSDVLAEASNVEVLGTASNGKIALDRIAVLRPDIVTLDIEMPEMNGLAVLREIKDRKLDVGVIVLSALTQKGGDLTIKALQLGAFDFVTKPSGDSLEASKRSIRDALLPMVKVYGHRREIRSILHGRGGAVAPQPVNAAPNAGSTAVAGVDRRRYGNKPEMVAIAVSTGGPKALADLLPSLPGDLGVPIVIVQHMPALFTRSLAESLDAKSAIRVKEAENREIIVANTAYIAPGGKQMKLVPGPNGAKMIEVNDDPPENNCRPAADYLFRSIAHHFPGRASAVIMTGMGSDGTLGLRLLKRHGCYIVAQDELSSVVFGMPKEAIQAGVVDSVVPLSGISDEICRSVRRVQIC